MSRTLPCECELDTARGGVRLWRLFGLTTFGRPGSRWATASRTPRAARSPADRRERCF